MRHHAHSAPTEELGSGFACVGPDFSCVVLSEEGGGFLLSPPHPPPLPPFPCCAGGAAAEVDPDFACDPDFASVFGERDAAEQDGREMGEEGATCGRLCAHATPGCEPGAPCADELEPLPESAHPARGERRDRLEGLATCCLAGS